MIRARTCVAFAIAPLAPALLLEGLRRSGLTVGGVEFAIATYPVALVVGPPAHLLFERIGLTRGWHYALGGFLGMFVGLSLLMTFAGGEEDQLASGYSALMGLLTTSATLTFWGIAVRGTTTRRQSRSGSCAPGGCTSRHSLYVACGASYVERRTIQRRLDVADGIANADLRGDRSPS